MNQAQLDTIKQLMREVSKGPDVEDCWFSIYTNSDDGEDEGLGLEYLHGDTSIRHLEEMHLDGTTLHRETHYEVLTQDVSGIRDINLEITTSPMYESYDYIVREDGSFEPLDVKKFFADNPGGNLGHYTSTLMNETPFIENRTIKSEVK